jgi:hypothetical protein
MAFEVGMPSALARSREMCMESDASQSGDGRRSACYITRHVEVRRCIEIRMSRIEEVVGSGTGDEA